MLVEISLIFMPSHTQWSHREETQIVLIECFMKRLSHAFVLSIDALTVS